MRLPGMVLLAACLTFPVSALARTTYATTNQTCDGWPRASIGWLSVIAPGS